MRSFSSDSRMVLLILVADAMVAGGRGLAKVVHDCSRAGRISRLVRRLEEAGCVGRMTSGPTDERLLQVTERGRLSVLGTVDPEALWARPWDGTWRFVLFDVPQSEARLRTKLRRRLRSMRFGWLQNSVWLSPDSVNEFTRQLDREQVSVESLVVIDGRPSSGETDAELVAGAWDFAKIAQMHTAYLKLLRLRPTKSRDTSLEAWKSWITAESRSWTQIERHDPFLPAALHPPGYAGPAVWHARLEALQSAGTALAQSLDHG